MAKDKDTEPELIEDELWFELDQYFNTEPPAGAVTTREIARRYKITTNAAYNRLKTLEDKGIMSRIVIGKTAYWSKRND